jgi:hypothetical protein
VQVPGGKTSYLSELSAGSEVLIAGPGGEQRSAIVGRVKIEARPLVSSRLGRAGVVLPHVQPVAAFRSRCAAERAAAVLSAAQQSTLHVLDLPASALI